MKLRSERLPQFTSFEFSHGTRTDDGEFGARLAPARDTVTGLSPEVVIRISSPANDVIVEGREVHDDYRYVAISE